MSFLFYINYQFPIKRLKDSFCLKSEKVSVRYKPLTDPDYHFLRRTNKFFIKTLVTNEDWSFYDHYGVDFRQLFHAIYDFLFHDKKLRGASTIEQQLIKNCFFSNERSIYRKMVEFFLSIQLNFILNKRQILERYLNTVEFAPGIYSIKKASWYLFKKKPSMLSREESVILVSLFPNPKYYAKIWSKMVSLNQLNKRMVQRIERVLSMIKLAKIISEEEKKNLKESLLNYKFTFP